MIRSSRKSLRIMLPSSTKRLSHQHGAFAINSLFSVSDSMVFSQSSSIPSLHCRRDYHSVRPLMLAVRRRKRAVENAAGESTGTKDSDSQTEARPSLNKAVAQGDPKIFLQCTLNLIEKLEKAIAPMKAKNDPFDVAREDNDDGPVLTIRLGPKLGFYRLAFHIDECLLEYSSPISGTILYHVTMDAAEWVGVEDGHALEGIFVRDLIRQCQGLPNL